LEGRLYSCSNSLDWKPTEPRFALGMVCGGEATGKRLLS
jgi:hypothetical protein